MREKFWKGLDNFLSLVGSLSLVAMIFCIALNVICRFVFHKGFAWSEEYGYLFFCYTIFIGAAACYGKQELISINVFVLMLPKIVQKGIFYFKRIVMVFVNSYLFYLSVLFSINAAGKMTTLMRIPYTYMDLALALMFFFAIIYSFRDVIRAFLKKDVMETERKAE